MCQKKPKTERQHLVQTQPMGKNTISNLKTIVAGILALKEVTKSSPITVRERQQSATEET